MDSFSILDCDKLINYTDCEHCADNEVSSVVKAIMMCVFVLACNFKVSQKGDCETDLQAVVCAGSVQVLDIYAKGGHVRFKI